MSIRTSYGAGATHDKLSTASRLTAFATNDRSRRLIPENRSTISIGPPLIAVARMSISREDGPVI